MCEGWERWSCPELCRKMTLMNTCISSSLQIQISNPKQLSLYAKPAVPNCRTTLNCSVVFLCVVLPAPTSPIASGGLGCLCSLLLALLTWGTALTPALPRETGQMVPQSPRSRKVKQPTPLRNGVCKGTGQGWLRKGRWAREQNAASSFLYKKWWYSAQTARCASAAGLYS